MTKNKIILVQGISITTFKQGKDDFISLTDIARNKNQQNQKMLLKTGCGQELLLNF